MLRRVVLHSFSVLFSLLFAIVFVAQILSMMALYSGWIAIPSTLIVAVFAYLAYHRFHQGWLNEIESEQETPSLLRNTMLLCSIVIVFLVFVVRMVLWPQSELGLIIPNDFLNYHGIKILDLLHSGSVWNLAIPYGQYPYGYESLTVFGMFFTGDIRVVGTVHALIFLLFWLTIALLLRRYTKMPLEFALLGSLILCFIPFLYSTLLVVGKNDVLLSLTALLAILHAPVGNKSFHPIGLAFATMLSLATKATGLYILFYLWGLVLWHWFQAYRQGKFRDYLSPKVFVLCIVLMFPGGLWVIRNYLVMGEIFTSEVASFFQTSLAANLTNSSIYQASDSRGLLIAAILWAAAAIASGFKKDLGWSMLFLLIVIALTFIVTPLTAFLTVQSTVMDVQWRFVVHGLVMLAIVLSVYIWGGLQVILFRALSSYQKLAPILSVALLIMIISFLALLDFDDLFAYEAERGEQLIDPYGEQQSIYDYARTELDEGVVYVERVKMFYVMYTNPKLTVTEGYLYPLGHAEIYDKPIPDYILFVPTSRASKPTLRTLENDNQWELIYEDETGQVYQRKP